MLVMRNPVSASASRCSSSASRPSTPSCTSSSSSSWKDKFEELTARTQVFASLDAIVQSLVIITQLSLTGFIATRLGVIVLLVTIPIVMVFGLTVFAAFGTFSVHGRGHGAAALG